MQLWYLYCTTRWVNPCNYGVLSFSQTLLLIQFPSFIRKTHTKLQFLRFRTRIPPSDVVFHDFTCFIDFIDFFHITICIFRVGSHDVFENSNIRCVKLWTIYWKKASGREFNWRFFKITILRRKTLLVQLGVKKLLKSSKRWKTQECHHVFLFLLNY